MTETTGQVVIQNKIVIISQLKQGHKSHIKALFVSKSLIFS